MSNKRKILIEFTTADIDRYGDFLITTRIDVYTICVKSPIKTIKLGWSLEMIRDLACYGIDVEKESIKLFNHELENE